MSKQHEDPRVRPQTGDVILVADSVKGIRWYQKMRGKQYSHFTHAAIVVDDRLILEAQFAAKAEVHTVRRWKSARREKKPEQFTVLRHPSLCQEETRNRVVRAAKFHHSSSYTLAGTINLDKQAEDGKAFCSGLVYRILMDTGLVNRNKPDPLPADLYEILVSAGFERLDQKDYWASESEMLPTENSEYIRMMQGAELLRDQVTLEGFTSIVKNARFLGEVHDVVGSILVGNLDESAKWSKTIASGSLRPLLFECREFFGWTGVQFLAHHVGIVELCERNISDLKSDVGKNFSLKKNFNRREKSYRDVISSEEEFIKSYLAVIDKIADDVLVVSRRFTSCLGVNNSSPVDASELGKDLLTSYVGAVLDLSLLLGVLPSRIVNGDMTRLYSASCKKACIDPTSVASMHICGQMLGNIEHFLTSILAEVIIKLYGESGVNVMLQRLDAMWINFPTAPTPVPTAAEAVTEMSVGGE